jgi:flagellar hook-associated protein 2
MGIQFGGLATGLDTGAIITQLVELKRAPIYRLQARLENYEAQKSALDTLKTKLLALQDAAANLDSTSEFSSLTGTTSDEDYLTVDIGSDAAPGNHTVEILSLATAQRNSSQGYASLDDSVGSGVMSFSINGETTDLNLTGYTSIEDLKNHINNDVDGVSATIINTGSETDPYRLVLSGSEAGSDNAFSVDISGLSGGLAPMLIQDEAAQDAHLEVDGHEVWAGSNSSDEIISGVTLNLLDTVADPINDGKVFHINIDVDKEGIAENAKVMVDAYNDMFAFIEENQLAGGVLRDNPSLRTIASRMENIFTSSLDGGLGSISRFAEVGITRGTGRQLDWDEDDFVQALQDDFNSVRDLFIERDGNLGKSYLIDQAVDSLTDSINGIFKIGQDALKSKIDNTNTGIDRYERSVASYQTTMERKFTAMEIMVAQLQAQGSYLTSTQG